MKDSDSPARSKTQMTDSLREMYRRARKLKTYAGTSTTAERKQLM